MGGTGRRWAGRGLLAAALVVAGLGLRATAVVAQSCNPNGGVAGCPTTTTTTPPRTTTTMKTTTTPPPTTTTTTLPPTTPPRTTTTIRSTPTTRRTIPPTTRTTVTTIPPTTAPPPTIPATTLPPPPPATVPSRVLELSQPSVEPGGQLNVHGTGCTAASDVRLSIGDATVGTAVADAEGVFSAPIAVPDVPLGQYQVVAVCGPTLSSPLDLAVATSADSGTGTLGLFFFFFLLVLMLFRRRRLVRRRRTPDEAATP